jgi:hypothetical protein
MATDRPTTPRTTTPSAPKTTKRTTTTTTTTASKPSTTRAPRTTSTSSTRPSATRPSAAASTSTTQSKRDTPTQRKAPINDVAKPLLAYVGAADLAVEKLRTLQASAGSEVRRLSDRVGGLTVEAVKVPNQVGTTVRALPEAVTSQLSGLQGRAAEIYNSWAHRGERRVTEIRRNPATEEAVTRTRTAVSRGRAASTSARRAADAVGKAAATNQPFVRRGR